MSRGGDDWKSLGEQLRARRVALGFSKSRPQFLAERGWPEDRTSRTVANIERGDQPGYDPETKILIEDLYGLRRGTIDRFLRGAVTALETVEGDVQLETEPRVRDDEPPAATGATGEALPA